MVCNLIWAYYSSIHCQLGPSDSFPLMQGVGKACQLVTLSLVSCRIGDEGLAGEFHPKAQVDALPPLSFCFTFLLLLFIFLPEDQAKIIKRGSLLIGWELQYADFHIFGH